MNDFKNTEGSVSIKRLTGENCSFTVKNGFAAITLSDNSIIEKRAFFHRNFPFDMLSEYISVLDAEQSEIGIIYSLDDFDADTAELIRNELSKKYYQPVIKSISAVKERYGFSYWQVKTDDERQVNFTVKDTFRSIIRVGEDKAIVLDVDGNRFVIESLAGLDRKSFRKIELYL